MIKQAIIPLAGLGTRLLPLTSVIPKELLPINGKPGLEYILEECISSGITEIIFIISKKKGNSWKPSDWNYYESLTKKDIEKIHRNTLLTFNTFVLITLLIGGYDGAIGPGTGSFFMLAFVSLRGMALLNATYNTKVVNFASNLGSLITFIYLDLVNWSIGFVMAAGQILGAYCGSNLTIKKGAKIIKPTLVIMSLLMSLRLLLA